jgi:RNA polymerase sigma-70 factor (ECF subfamily)
MPAAGGRHKFICSSSVESSVSIQIDPEHLSAMYRRHSRPMLVYFTHRTFDAQLAIDLVGETFARAFANRRRFRGNSEPDADAWLWAIARNALADALRRGRAERRALRRLAVQTPRLTEGETERVEQLADLPRIRRDLGRALSRLRPEQIEAVRLRVVLQLEYREVAATLGVSEATARSRVSRGLRALNGDEELRVSLT